MFCMSISDESSKYMYKINVKYINSQLWPKLEAKSH